MPKIQNDVASSSVGIGSHAAGTVSTAHQHDQMKSYAVYMTAVDDAPAAVTVASANVTITGDYFKSVAHGYKTGLQLILTTTSALPTGLANNVTYYAVKLDVDTFGFALTRAAALAGTLVDITNVGSGNQTTKITALTALDVHLEYSIDGSNWADIPGSTLAAVGSTIMSYSSIAYNYVRVESTFTAGQITNVSNFRSIS